MAPGNTAPTRSGIIGIVIVGYFLSSCILPLFIAKRCCALYADVTGIVTGWTMTPEDLVEFCRDHAQAWWAGSSAQTPQEGWPALRKFISAPSLWPLAKQQLRGNKAALGMLRAFIHMAASSSPQANVAVAGFPVLAKGALAGNSALVGGLADLGQKLAELLEMRPGSVRIVPKVIEARALTALSPSGLRSMCEEIWAKGDSELIQPAGAWDTWDERMLLLLVSLRDPVATEPPSRLAAAAVQEYLAARLAGSPLYVVAQALQPLHRLYLAAEMFAVQKALRAVASPEAITLVQGDGEWILRSRVVEVALTLPGAPDEWLLSAIRAKVASVGGTLKVEDRRAPAGAA
jgi:hypothetical protein